MNLSGSTVWRFIRERDGQDIVETGLIVGIIAVALVLVVFGSPRMLSKMTASYSNWGTRVSSLWVPRPPQ